MMAPVRVRVRGSTEPAGPTLALVFAVLLVCKELRAARLGLGLGLSCEQLAWG